jgi:hypothetical protein
MYISNNETCFVLLTFKGVLQWFAVSLPRKKVKGWLSTR